MSVFGSVNNNTSISGHERPTAGWARVAPYCAQQEILGRIFNFYDELGNVNGKKCVFPLVI
jgi:hypothetical protein